MKIKEQKYVTRKERHKNDERIMLDKDIVNAEMRKKDGLGEGKSKKYRIVTIRSHVVKAPS